MTDPTIINDFMQTFINLINSGFGLIDGDVRWLFTALLIITITLTGLFWAFGERDTLGPLFRKILLIGLFAFILDQWVFLSNSVVETFIMLGLKAGGDTMSVPQFMDPGAIAIRGVEIFVLLFDAAGQRSTGPISFFQNFAEIVVYVFCGLIVIVAFFVIALQIFVAVLEFKLVSLAGFVLLPFAILKQTSFASERALGFILSSGVKLLILGLVVSIGTSLFADLVMSPSPGINEALGVVMGSATLLTLALSAPAVAGGLITGGPSLGAGAALAGMAGAAALTFGGGYAAMRGGAAAVGAARNSLAAVKAATAISGIEGVAAGTAGGLSGGSASSPASLSPPPQQLPPPGGQGSTSPHSGGGGGGGGGGFSGGAAIDTTPMSPAGSSRSGLTRGQQSSQSGSIFDGFKPENIGKPGQPIYDRGPAQTTGTSAAVAAAVMAARAVRPNDGGGGMVASGSTSED